ncbi:DUF4249 domain-containing protein [Pedobacter alpinus]|uniref:DUF4249 domain-containing protein n=1 Tax=Pedobacter alpinus TaxID=1590643 RepID=A0ABW5TTB2_9SPHI
MKNIYLILLSVTLLFSACEDVIEIDLKNTNPVVVIEANINDVFGSHIVKISQTKPFTEDNTVISINNADVVLKDLTENRTYNFARPLNGNDYILSNFRGKSGNTYQLEATVNNILYTATCKMPQKVNIDSLSVTELSFFGNTQKYLQVNYNDPLGVANQYNYVLTVNGEVRNAFYVDSDRFNDGKKVTNTIFNDDPELVKGDSVKIDFQCIDMTIYRYFFAISQISGNGGPPTAPSNPDSNFNNGALGYFSAHTSQTKTAVIP